MASLVAQLPEELTWLTEKVEGLVRPAAFLVHGPRQRKTGHPVEAAPLGGTFTDGIPDVPSDAPWAEQVLSSRAWMEHPDDGESFMLQLNLEDLPDEIARQHPSMPRVGVVWVTIDFSDEERGWQGKAYFDPRPAREIPWAPRTLSSDRRLHPTRSSFLFGDTLPFATPKTLPEIAEDWREGGLGHLYDEWRSDEYSAQLKSDIQLGGWIHPIQGDFEIDTTLVAAMTRQSFGDHGALYLRYSTEDGFAVDVQTH